MNVLRFLIVAISLVLVAPVFAQSGAQPVVNETLGVTISAPEGWELVKTQGNDKSLANFRHPESQSHVEVIGSKMINTDVAQVFFDTFHQSLIGAEFVEATSTTDATVGGRAGKQTEYSFEHTGIKLRVVVFGFTEGDAAYLVIGYFKDDERETYFPALEEVVKSLQFS